MEEMFSVGILSNLVSGSWRNLRQVNHSSLSLRADAARPVFRTVLNILSLENYNRNFQDVWNPTTTPPEVRIREGGGCSNFYESLSYSFTSFSLRLHQPRAAV